MIEGFEVFLKLKRRVKLVDVVRTSRGEHLLLMKPTSANGTRGGPDSMSTALVPGRILLVAPSSSLVRSARPGELFSGFLRPGEGMLDEIFMFGDLGPSWTSGNGGGLGSRGELEGERAPMSVAMVLEEQR